mmetsp:Transcript_22237/g.48855  ORF Transcript_22237/g.48855 Transcript_22237/m.48855 type:complete len:202 (+) Transcript_22237:897-1502(+)
MSSSRSVCSACSLWCLLARAFCRRAWREKVCSLSEELESWRELSRGRISWRVCCSSFTRCSRSDVCCSFFTLDLAALRRLAMMRLRRFWLRGSPPLMEDPEGEPGDPGTLCDPSSIPDVGGIDWKMKGGVARPLLPQERPRCGPPRPPIFSAAGLSFPPMPPANCSRLNEFTCSKYRCMSSSCISPWLRSMRSPTEDPPWE